MVPAQKAILYTGGCFGLPAAQAPRDRVVGESSISGLRWDNEPATGIFRSPTGLATADPRCAWALATRRSFRWRPAPCSTRRPVGPRGELVGLRRVAHGQQRPDGDSKNEDGDDDDHEDFHRILLLDGCSPLGRVCCASASTVPLQFGVLGHMERDGYLPRAGANTPADAGLTRCARACGLERCSLLGLSGRSRSTPATGPPRCKRWSRTVGTRTCPAMLHYPR